ncbi:MAG: Cof-type HAD-IIB family hydrolase [Faecalibacterium sp.]
MSNPIRLIALDLDGTLLNDRKELTAPTVRALTAAAERGVWIVPATGRTASGVPAALRALPGVRYAITANGARVIDLVSGETLRELYIPQPLALDAYDRLMQYECVVDIFQDGQGYTSAANRAQIDRFVPENLRPYIRTTRQDLPDMRAYIAAQQRGLEKFTLFFLTDAERLRAWNEMTALGLEVVSSLPLNMELNAAGVNKGAGLLALADALGLPASALMACGDGGNDIEMLRAAGLGVAMANGFPEVRAAADFVTRSNEEDGVAYAIERFVLD